RGGRRDHRAHGTAGTRRPDRHVRRREKDPVTASKIGLGSVIGFISSVITKGIIQLLMIGYFIFVVFS
ncbi:hypothetical protein ACFVSH_07845, partial [Peribacillus sp. NPDC058002]